MEEKQAKISQNNFEEEKQKQIYTIRYHILFKNYSNYKDLVLTRLQTRTPDLN